MADRVIIGGIEESALEYIARFLRKTKDSISNSIRNVNTDVSVNSLEEQEKQLENLEKREKELLNDKKVYNDYIDNLTDKLANMGRTYEQLSSSEKRIYTITQNKLKIAFEHTREIEKQIDLISNEKNLLEINIKNTEKENKNLSEKSKIIQKTTQQLQTEAEYRDKRYDIEKKQREDWFNDQDNKLKKLDELEDSLFKRRQLRNQRQRERSLKLEEKTTDAEGRTKTNKEWQEIKNKFREFREENTFERRVGIGLSKATNLGAKGISFIDGGKMDIGSIADKTSGALSNLGPYGAAAGGFIQILKTAFDMYSKVNTAASKFARTVGGGAQAIGDIETRLAQVGRNLSNVTKGFDRFNKRAYDTTKLIESLTEYSAAIGRNTQYMSEQQIAALQDLKDYGISMDVLNQFDTFGLATEEISKRLAGVYNAAGKHGLNAKAVTDTMVKNLKMAQQYTFSGGLRALERMAEKSVELKYNMDAVSRFAEKVGTLEGAMQTGAGLSVLGGNFARMGNPLSMLYGGLQDAEKLNDIMLNMTKGMAFWDSSKGQMDITAHQRMLLKAASQQMGVDYNDLYNQTIRQGELSIIDNQIGGGVKDEDTRKFIRNIATIKDGKAYVSLKTGKKNAYGEDEYEDKLVSSLTDEDKVRLGKESKDKQLKEGATLGDVITQTRSTQERLDQIIEQIKQKIVRGIFGIYNWLDKRFNHSKNQISLESMSLSDEQSKNFETLQKARDKGIANLSNDEQKYLSSIGIKDDRQLSSRSDDDLVSMLNNNSQIPQQKAYGGEIRGRGTSKSDSIPAMLSNGEFVMNEKATQKHLPTLNIWNAEGLASGSITPIRAGSNQTNPLSVVAHLSNGMGFGNNFTQLPPMSIAPIKIDISGTINLTGGGASKSIDVRELLNDNVFLGQLKNKLQWYTTHALDKNLSDMKYPIPLV